MNLHSDALAPALHGALDAAPSNGNAFSGQPLNSEEQTLRGEGERSPESTDDAGSSDRASNSAQSSDLVNPLKDLCVDLEAFETPRWALEALLKVEILSRRVFDPCAGTGIIADVVHEAGYQVFAIDIEDWSKILPTHQIHWWGVLQKNFLTDHFDLTGDTVVMNPPFSLACEFVNRAFELGARKVGSSQRQAWRESKGRRDWWEKNRPSRVWVCGERASCWRFDMIDCRHEGGETHCPNKNEKIAKWSSGCSKCRSNAPTAHAFYVWERGHSGAEITSAIYPPAKAKKVPA